tara:strand:+ start:3263 stop:4840 length:1578 start_codon:yes stop_codon:yes gene_type:complete
MKRVWIAYTAILVVLTLSIIAYVQLFRTPELSPSELDEILINWDIITKENWSPWVMQDGESRWDPAAGYHTWIRSLDPDLTVWEGLLPFARSYEQLMLEDGVEDLYGLPFDSKYWITIREWHIEHRDEINELTQVLNRPYFGVPRTDNREDLWMSIDTPEALDQRAGTTPINLYNSLFRQLRPFVRAQFVVREAALVELSEGDTERFIELIGKILESNRHYMEFPDPSDQNLMLTVFNGVLDSVLWGLEFHSEQFTDSHLVQLDTIISAHLPDGLIAEGSILLTEDILRRKATSGGGYGPARELLHGFSDGHMPVERFSEVSSIPTDELKPSMQQAMLDMYRKIRYASERSSLPWDGNTTNLREALPNGKSVNRLLGLMSKYYVGYHNSYADRYLTTNQFAIGTRTTIALYRHKLMHGQFPSSIDGVDEVFLRFEPIDHFTNEPLKLRLSENTPVVYSVGPDRIDDGGEQIHRVMYGTSIRTMLRNPDWISNEEADARRMNEAEALTGDFVIYPVPRDDPFEDDE